MTFMKGTSVLNLYPKIIERNESSCILKFIYGPFPIRRVINESSTGNIYIYIGWRTCNQKWWIIFGCGPNPDCHTITSDPLCRTQFSSDAMTLLAKDPMQPGDNKFQQSTIFFFVWKIHTSRVLRVNLRIDGYLSAPLSTTNIFQHLK